MKESTTAPSDFAGFINGFEARNLASIQRNIVLQLSEMQTRLAVIRGQIKEAGAALAPIDPGFSAVEAAFREHTDNVVARLETVGQQLKDLLIRYGDVISSKPAVCVQVKGLVRAYFEAAEISRNERLLEAAIRAAEALQDVAAPAPG